MFNPPPHGIPDSPGRHSRWAHVAEGQDRHAPTFRVVHVDDPVRPIEAAAAVRLRQERRLRARPASPPSRSFPARVRCTLQAAVAQARHRRLGGITHEHTSVDDRFEQAAAAIGGPSTAIIARMGEQAGQTVHGRRAR
jgi:hypothetical protein